MTQREREREVFGAVDWKESNELAYIYASLAYLFLFFFNFKFSVFTYLEWTGILRAFWLRFWSFQVVSAVMYKYERVKKKKIWGGVESTLPCNKVLWMGGVRYAVIWEVGDEMRVESLNKKCLWLEIGIEIRKSEVALGGWGWVWVAEFYKGPQNKLELLHWNFLCLLPFDYMDRYTVETWITFFVVLGVNVLDAQT